MPSLTSYSHPHPATADLGSGRLWRAVRGGQNKVSGTVGDLGQSDIRAAPDHISQRPCRSGPSKAVHADRVELLVLV